jgi:putative flippase GtrA
MNSLERGRGLEAAPISRPALLRHLLASFRFAKAWSLARYFVAGSIVSFGYTITVILLVDQLGWFSPSSGSLVSFVLWTPASFLSHRDFTFRADEGAGSTAALKFVIVFGLRFAASGLAVLLVTDYLHLHYLFGLLVNWILLPAISYFVMRFWVFQ